METILIIDDDVAIGNLEQEVLEREGYLVQRAYSGTESNLFRTLHPANGSKDHGRRDRADDPCHETVILCNGNP